MSEEELERLREEVRRITEEIIHLVGTRLSLIREIGRIKRGLDIPPTAPEVEEALRETVLEACKEHNVGRKLGVAILNLLIREGVELQGGGEGASERTILYELFGEAKRLEGEGRKVIHMEVGEPDYGPPERVAEATTRALIAGYTRYTTSAGLPVLRRAVAEDLQRTHGVDVKSEQTIMTIGGKYAIYLAIKTLVSLGDEVIIFEPAWPVYRLCVEQVGGYPVTIKTRLEDAWSPDLEALEEAVNPSTRMMIISNPGNPTGKVYDEGLLRNLVETATENGLVVLSDEVYTLLSFKPFKSIFDLTDRDFVYVNSFSKTYGMTGFRVGYAVSDEETIRKMARMQSISVTSVPEFIQYGALEALKCGEEAEGYKELIAERLEAACRELDRLPTRYHRPDGAFYVFPEVEEYGFDSVAFAWRLLKEKGVCVVPGTAFGDYPTFMRLSACIGVPLIREGIGRMGDLLG
jgi:aspartate aminotransferase